ncbi:MAG: penicillin amidase [Spirosomataceae bacterium]|jgi:penicillin amidase
MKIAKAIGSLLVLFGLLYFLHVSVPGVPALGKLFNPFSGFWQNTERNIYTDEEFTIQGLKDEVVVKYDDMGVPHLFAQNDEDLYFAQGYIIARDRLWQMEFYTLNAAGRLTEVVGEAALEYDRYNRRMGMAQAAHTITEKLKDDQLSKSILEPYAAGVNARISELTDKDLPIEYKILGYKPEAWSVEKTVLMLMNMRQVLNGRSDDYRITNIVKKYGLEVSKDLFPNYPEMESPIIPVGTEWDFSPVEIPQVPSQIMANGDEIAGLNVPRSNPNIGSNNWAVHGSKSATGLPILANDPHLTLSLPSIWYQMQLHSPNVNVYGVALPGSPCIVIGFNKDIAWGVTNVGSDVMDFYKIKFRDNSRSEYWYEGQWKPITKTLEKFKLKNGTVMVDTLLSTHHGPIVYNTNEEKNFSKDTPAGHAMRWVALETEGSDILTFHFLNRAKNYDDYRKALTYYVAPAQNFIFASNENDIAITPNGKLPLKWKGQGKYILDGSLASHDWQGWIPAEQNPHVKNPPRGFVSSANQSSTDPSYPYYMGWKYAPMYRGARINERLAAMQNATVDSLRMLQNDNFNIAAREILPSLLPLLNGNLATKNNPALQYLNEWNYVNNAESVAATIFENWFDNLETAIWEDEFSYDKYLMYPTDDRMFTMIKTQPDAKWFDNVNTKDKKETMADIVTSSFMATVDTLIAHKGKISLETWAWYLDKSTDIKHLVPQLTPFGRMDIKNGGGNKIVNATTNRTGPSWRMVVQLDKEWPKGYGLYPGGQSGNVGSKNYDNMIDKWTNGELNELLFLKDINETSERLKSTVKLRK